MKQLATLFLILFVSTCFAQISPMQMPENFCLNDNSVPNGSPVLTGNSTNGYLHTPKGNLHVLMIFMSNLSQVPNPLTFDGDINDPDRYWGPTSIPSWTMGASNKIFDATSATIGTNKNLSLFYKEMSHEQFIITGDIFPELIPTSNGSISAAIAYINSHYPNFDWSRYDNRTNSPNYATDNSTSSPDGIIDYVIVMKRVNGFSGATGTGSHTVTTSISGSPVNFTIQDGHTANYCNNSSAHHQIFFKHEFAHNIYSSPHYYSANTGSDGLSYYIYAGWGLMAGWHEQFNVANAWEQWWHGWITPQTISTSGVYQIQDFITEGDAIRIPIPNTDHQYLWIENHQKIDPTGWDDKPFYNHDAAHPDAEDIDPGLYMYITRTADDRLNPAALGAHFIESTNFIKTINGEGNFDISWNQGPQIAVPDGGMQYVFQKGLENPIAGQNTWNKIKWNRTNDLIMVTPCCHGNHGCAVEEANEVWAEMINGVPTPTYSRQGRHNQGFVLNSEVGLSGRVPILNYPLYNCSPDYLDPYILNGLSIKVTNYDASTGIYTINVNFSDYEVRNNKRWCGNIQLPPNPLPNVPCLVIASGVNVTIDKSGTPNQKFEVTPGSRNFIKPTVMDCLPNSFIKLESNSSLIVDNSSTLKLEANARLDIASGATLRVKHGGHLELKTGSILNVANGGRIIIEEDALASNGTLDYFQGALINLNGTNAVLEIQGFLNIKDNANFTFGHSTTTNGYVVFNNTTLSPSRNIIAGSNCSMNFNGYSSVNG